MAGGGGGVDGVVVGEDVMVCGFLCLRNYLGSLYLNFYLKKGGKKDFWRYRCKYDGISV